LRFAMLSHGLAAASGDAAKANRTKIKSFVGKRTEASYHA
jgi:hypothetical protein